MLTNGALTIVVAANFVLLSGGILGGALFVRHTIRRTLRMLDCSAKQQNGPGCDPN